MDNKMVRRPKIDSHQILSELQDVLKNPNHKEAEKLHRQIGHLTPDDLFRRFTL